MTRPAWPSAWPSPVTARQIGVSLFMLGLTAFLFLGAVLAARGGDPRAPFIALLVPLVAVCTLQVLAIGLRGRRHHPAAVTSAEVPALQGPALVIRYCRSQAWSLLAGAVITTLVMAILSAAFLVAGLADFPRYWSAALPAALTLPLAGYLLLIVIQVGRHQVGRGLIALGLTGIYHRAWTYEAYLPWAAVLTVYPWDGGGPYVTVEAAVHAQSWYRRRSGLWCQPDYDFQPDIVLPGHALPIDPAVLLSLVTYYADHPANRAELGDTRAVHRVQTGSF